MYSNWALRSGCAVTFQGLAVALQAVARFAAATRATVRGLTGWCLPRQLLRQLASCSCRSSATATPDRRGSVGSTKLVQRMQQLGVSLGAPLAPATLAPQSRATAASGCFPVPQVPPTPCGSCWATCRWRCSPHARHPNRRPALPPPPIADACVRPSHTQRSVLQLECPQHGLILHDCVRPQPQNKVNLL